MTNAYLYLEDKKYRLLDFAFGFSQRTGTNNKPAGVPMGGEIQVTVESSKDVTMLDWTVHNNMQKDGRIVIMGRDNASIDFKLEFANAYATMADYSYNSQSSEPMQYSITITPGILRFNGDNAIIYKNHWGDPTAFDKPDYYVRDENEIEPIPNEGYFTTLSGDKISDDELEIGTEVYFVLKTQNAVGKYIDLDFADEKNDFKYNGTLLVNDILEDLKITSDTQKVKLQVIRQTA
ncbi:type VI secretion system tube protein TssD [Aquimarina agarivorans]|uniref:type VI secretion system tube protein TssD n=1 Tax=Aquimarina agarivorans TaxID=980584 RepID=UPI000248F8EB|nr:type VI secretion system tube protein TssD [Aquimarina agarivorans]